MTKEFYGVDEPDDFDEAAFRRWVREEGLAAAKRTLLDVMENRKGPAAPRVQAASAVLRASGLFESKPAQPEELAGPDFSKMTDEELRALDLRYTLELARLEAEDAQPTGPRPDLSTFG